MSESSASPQERPQLMFDDTDEIASVRVKTLDQEIWKHPKHYLRALGIIAVLDTAELADNSTFTVDETDDAAIKILEFFENRYYLSISYDPDTENSIRLSVTMQEKVRKLEMTKKGTTQAEWAAQDLRQQRLQEYIKRVETWQASHQGEDFQAVG